MKLVAKEGATFRHLIVSFTVKFGLQTLKFSKQGEITHFSYCQMVENPV